jgi:hypothetical protein
MSHLLGRGRRSRGLKTDEHSMIMRIILSVPPKLKTIGT